MIAIREARGADTPAIRDIFLATYGADYPYPQYYDPESLMKMVYTDDTLILVAEDTADGRVLGTASVILEMGAYSDLVGEFGRLAVHPEARHRGIGRLLMRERVRLVRERLHVGLVEARVAHPYSVRIAEGHGFSAVGYLPRKMLVGRREDLAILARHFGCGLELRQNHPRIVPEIHALAHVALRNCGLPEDTIVDEGATSYPPGEDFAVQELTAEGYAALLRIERGRVRSREVFGPLRLHYGFFKIRARRSNYLVAREGERVAGAVGFTLDAAEKVVSIFELIALHDSVVRFLLAELERRCRDEWGVCFVEIDVSAYAPRMQRTLLELGFLPVAYVPAMVFHEVERLDVVKMARVLIRVEDVPGDLGPQVSEVAEVVLRGFRHGEMLPQIARAVRHVALFAGLEAEQVRRVAGACGVRRFEPEAVIFREGEPDPHLYLVLSGEVAVAVAGSATPVGTVGAGDCLGALALLAGTEHSATATARTDVEAAVLGYRDLAELARRRPDIGLLLYRNLASDVGKKLRRLDRALGEQAVAAGRH